MATDGRTPVVVVGVDGSDNSSDAVRWAMGQATLIGGSLRAVATWRWPTWLIRLPPGADVRVDPARIPAETSRILTEALDEVRAEYPDVPITEHVVEGPPGPALISQSGDADLLVVGARGRAAYPGMLLGSVAEHCVRNAPCPVVVIRTLPAGGTGSGS
jgi:nucleotide-binding universal stress UspA family protein